MRRRDAIARLAWWSVPVAAGRIGASRAQPAARLPRVGVLGGGSPATTGHFVEAFEGRMRELGYHEGRNIAYERRWGEGRTERLPALAAELVALPVDVILASTTFVIEAARRATATLPIVMATGGSIASYIDRGWIASLARPGGNLTGFRGSASEEMDAKRLELLKTMAPGIAKVAMVTELTPQPATSEGAQRLGLRLDRYFVRSAEDLDRALDRIAQDRPDALLESGGLLVFLHRQRVADLVTRLRLPAMSGISDSARTGLLMAYSVDLVDLFRRAAGYVDRILRGTPPGQLPIEQPTKFELVINARTARALGLAIPPALRLRADEVIE